MVCVWKIHFYNYYHISHRVIYLQSRDLDVLFMWLESQPESDWTDKTRIYFMISLWAEPRHASNLVFWLLRCRRCKQTHLDYLFLDNLCMNWCWSGYMLLWDILWQIPILFVFKYPV